MAAILSSIFHCCLGRRRKESVIPDEESRLIPAEETEPTPSIPNVVVVDHQKLKDRLGTIVRSKEGKMVNVNAPVAFNLHNHSQSLDPSSSRSASISTNHRFEFPQRHAALVAVPSNITSPSRGASVSRSSSTASGQYDSSRRGSLAPSEIDFRNPTLNARLVNKNYGSVVMGATPNRRGRPRVRGGGESRTIPVENHIAPDEDALQQPKGKEKQPPEPDGLPQITDTTTDMPDSDASPQTLTPVPPYQIPALAFDLDPTKPRPPLPAPEFKIQAADISLSWGD